MKMKQFNFKRFIVNAYNLTIKHFNVTWPTSIDYVEYFFSNIDNSKTKVLVTTTSIDVDHDCNYIIILRNNEISMYRIVVSAMKHII